MRLWKFKNYKTQKTIKYFFYKMRHLRTFFSRVLYFVNNPHFSQNLRKGAKNVTRIKFSLKSKCQVIDFIVVNIVIFFYFSRWKITEKVSIFYKSWCLRINHHRSIDRLYNPHRLIIDFDCNQKYKKNKNFVVLKYDYNSCF